MNDRQRRFVLEYLVDGNGTQAAIRAGYNKRSATSTAVKLLRYASIKAAISAKQQQLADLADISATEIIREFARIALFNVADIFEPSGRMKPIKEWTEDQQRAVASIEISQAKRGRPSIIKIRVHNKGDALTQLGRIRGLFIDKVEQVGVKPITLLMVDRTAPVIDGEASGSTSSG